MTMFDTPDKVFCKSGRLQEIGLTVPQITRVMDRLREAGIYVRREVSTLLGTHTECWLLCCSKIFNIVLLKGGKMLRYNTRSIFSRQLCDHTSWTRELKFHNDSVCGFGVYRSEFLRLFGIGGIFGDLCFCVKIVPKYLIKGLKPIMIFIVFTGLFNLFLTSGTPVWHWWIFTITREGIRFAAFMVLRLIFLILGTSLLTLTTSPIALTDGLEYLADPI